MRRAVFALSLALSLPAVIWPPKPAMAATVSLPVAEAR